MSAQPEELFRQIAGNVVTERKPVAPRGPSRINFQWTDYGSVTFSAVVTYVYDADGEYDDGRWYDCSSIDLRTCTVTHINGKAVPEFECDPYEVPGWDALEDDIREYERGGL